MDIQKLLTALTELPGPSGFESPVADHILDLWRKLADEVSLDRMGNVIALKKGTAKTKRPRLLVAAHMDQIGLMVKQLVSYPNEEGSGYLRLTNIGGVDRRVLPGQPVTVHSSVKQKPEISGIVQSLPDWMLSQNRRGKSVDYDDLLVDPGLSFKELQSSVSVGDAVTFRQPAYKLQGKVFAAASLDNRASVAALTRCLDYLQRRDHVWDLLAVATVQEELGLKGALTSGHSQAPDAALALDVTFATGPGTTDPLTFKLGGGPALGFGPHVHPALFDQLQKTADQLEMSVQLEPHVSRSGTDAGGLQLSREGIPTGLISIPLRYMHSQVETVDLRDVERAGRLAGEFVSSLAIDFIDGLTAYLLD